MPTSGNGKNAAIIITDNHAQASSHQTPRVAGSTGMTGTRKNFGSLKKNSRHGRSVGDYRISD